MHLLVNHSTQYIFEQPVDYALQQIRLTPIATNFQNVLTWNIQTHGAGKELNYCDQYGNLVTLIKIESGAEKISISCTGEVETKESHGLVGNHNGYMPLWLYKRFTDLTMPGTHIKKLIKDIDDNPEIETIHELSNLILDIVKYEKHITDSFTTAEEACKLGTGVCQDHAHILIAAARTLNLPARYVSGYLFIGEDKQETANHGWVEIYFAAVGWIGFDVSNGISPDERYIRLAVGLDASDSVPVKGILFGEHKEAMEVSVSVQQQSQ